MKIVTCKRLGTKIRSWFELSEKFVAFVVMVTIINTWIGYGMVTVRGKKLILKPINNSFTQTL